MHFKLYKLKGAIDLCFYFEMCLKYEYSLIKILNLEFLYKSHRHTNSP